MKGFFLFFSSNQQAKGVILFFFFILGLTMKILPPALCSALLLVLLSPFSIALLSADYSCPRDCVHERPVDILITFGNLGGEEVIILGIKAVDTLRGTTIAETAKAEVTTQATEAIGSDRPAYVTINRGGSHMFTLSGTLPSANNGSSLLFRICTIQRTPIESWGEIGSEVEFCFSENYSIAMLGCTDDADCSEDALCLDNACTALSCGYCEYAAEHRCIAYGCCANPDCRGDEVCEEHFCRAIGCEHTIYDAPTENITLEEAFSLNLSVEKRFIANHTCSAEPCMGGMVLENFSCVPAQCGEDEHVADFSCRKLNCSFYEGYANHSCIALNCSSGEGIANHSCMPLACADDETLLDYQCQKLICTFLQYPMDHRCVTNVIVLIELILVGFLAALFITDAKLLRGKFRKRLVAKLMERSIATDYPAPPPKRQGEEGKPSEKGEKEKKDGKKKTQSGGEPAREQ